MATSFGWGAGLTIDANIKYAEMSLSQCSGSCQKIGFRNMQLAFRVKAEAEYEACGDESWEVRISFVFCMAHRCHG